MKNCFENDNNVHVCIINNKLYIDGILTECDDVKCYKDGGTREYYFKEGIFTKGQKMFKPLGLNTLVNNGKKTFFKEIACCDTKDIKEDKLHEFIDVKKYFKTNGFKIVYEDSDSFFVDMP